MGRWQPLLLLHFLLVRSAAPPRPDGTPASVSQSTDDVPPPPPLSDQQLQQPFPGPPRGVGLGGNPSGDSLNQNANTALFSRSSAANFSAPSSKHSKQGADCCTEVAMLMEQLKALEKRVEALEGKVGVLVRKDEEEDAREWLQRIDGSKYKLYEDELTWPEAQKMCKTNNAQLVTVDNEELNTFLIELLKTRPHIHAVWLATRTRPRISATSSFTNFSPKQGPEGCTSLQADGTWELRECEETPLAFVCEMAAPPSERKQMVSEEEEADPDWCISCKTNHSPRHRHARHM